ncbi:MAG: glycosyl transferase [Alphaproteobacteria bacterium]|nr:glycosyl transferase [Alphaproteobacteria bacterium]
MKILHVITALDPPGGAEHKLVRLARHQRLREGLSPVVLSLGPTGPLGEVLREAGIPVETAGFKGRGRVLWGLWHLVRLIRRERPDVVQTWMYHADLLGGVAARLAGNRNVVWGIRNTDLYPGDGNSRLIKVMKLCASLSRLVPRAIVCVAEAARARHAALGYDEKRMVVIPNGYDPDPLTDEPRDAARAALGLPQAAIVVGSVGRYNHYKDQLNFVRAMGVVAAAREDVRFLLVGRGNVPENAELAAAIAATGAAERFHLLGHRTDAGRCFAAMDVFCLHSKSEGFPNVLAEAMLAGIPSVATDVGDARLLSAGHAEIVPPRDSAALAEAVLVLVGLRPAERSARGEEGRRHIRSHYSLERIAGLYLGLYRAVMAGRADLGRLDAPAPSS